jgi:hypothetical protein
VAHLPIIKSNTTAMQWQEPGFQGCVRAANDFTRSQAEAGRSAPRPALALLSGFSKSMRECPGRLVQGHGFGLGTAGAGTVAGAGALIGGFGLDILPTPSSMLFIPGFIQEVFAGFTRATFLGRPGCLVRQSRPCRQGQASRRPASRPSW